MRKEEKIKILMVAAEVAPLAKVGGLGDVVGSLPKALSSSKCEVRLIMPKYPSIDEKQFGLKKIISKIPVCVSGKIESINIWQTNLPGTKIIVYLVESRKYFSDKNPYAGNNSEKFLFFSLAVMYALPLIPYLPHIIHCHDFHTAMIADVLKVENFYSPQYCDVKTLYTIHNLNFQGQSGIEVLKTGNLNKDLLKSLSVDAQNGDINFMVQGIINADAVNTVSPTYAKEIKASVYGAGLERIIRANSKKLSGIINGIDLDFFNPSKDPLIFQRYNHKKIKSKINNKIKLFKSLNIKAATNKPLVALVSRFSWQKGLDLITEDLLKVDANFIFLGTGDKKYELQLDILAKKFPEKATTLIRFDEKLAHQIYAAADIFLVPSRFEPCGLTQMIAMQYGAVPIVRATGGLADTVDSKVGFKFKEFNAKALRKILVKAINAYQKKPKEWRKLQINGMKKDFSWKNPAKEYLKLYYKLIK
jgi:starch synthase